jgi:3-hydroxyisobutyrate dehydrogenase
MNINAKPTNPRPPARRLSRPGRDGLPMAGHLATRRPPRHGLQPHGSQGRPHGWPSSAAAMRCHTARGAAGADIVFACVGNDDDLRSVTLGADGAFAGMAGRGLRGPHHRLGRSGARAARRRANAGLHFVDAPVSGGQAGAERRADRDVRRRRRAFERHAPVAMAFSRAVTRWATAAPASWPRWSTRSASPAWCRACPRPSPSARRPGWT